VNPIALPGLDVEVPRAGVQVVHDNRFLIDRPSGSGDFLFLHFLTPIDIREEAGVRTAPPGSCMLYAPGFHQWYRNPRDGFRHHWFHFGGPSATALVERYRIPLNTVFQPWGLDFVPALITDMKREQSRREPFWNDSVASLVEHFLIMLARHTAMPSADELTPHLGELMERFRDVRTRVHDELHRQWAVHDMARLVNLSESRFAKLFSDFFQVSPVEDLIRARLEKARWLLTNTSLAIKQVAAQSGFPNIHYFSRLFRRRVGCPPRDYYRRFVASGMRSSA
jgi:AraC-like DNA-binding protein